MLSYALDVWRVSWITAASKAQSRLLAVPEDTALQKKKKRETERKRKGEIFIKLLLINKKLVYLIFCMCLCLEALWKSSRRLQLAACAHPTAGQLARQLQEDYYMHLWNIQMAVCPTVH